jgi:hypothetical protein
MWYRNLTSSRYGRLLVIAGWAGCAVLLSFRLSLSAQDAVVDSALRWILRSSQAAVQYNYVMTARVRLLLFWVGSDDVGGGYIRRSNSVADPEVRMIEVLFGSDPVKAPRRINHWGAATEAYDGHSTRMLGFMKSAKTGSASDAEAEIRRQNAKGEHPFEALLGIVERDHAIARKTTLVADSDLNIHHLSKAQELAVRQLQREGKTRELRGPALKCDSGRGFLQTVDDLTSMAINGAATPSSKCYVYNAKNYTLTLKRAARVKSKKIDFQRKKGAKIEKTYADLLDLEFVVTNHASGERTDFQMLVGTTGQLSGVPIQIVHQPNWWFQVVLNLDTVKR